MNQKNWKVKTRFNQHYRYHPISTVRKRTKLESVTKKMKIGERWQENLGNRSWTLILGIRKGVANQDVMSSKLCV